MFKKIAGLFLAAAIMCGSAAITASAAEVEEEATVGASEESNDSGAAEESNDSGAQVSDESSSASSTIYFDVEKSGWNNVKKVYCHVWKADGTGDWPGWQTKKELCKYDSSTGIASYDLSKTGNTISKSDGKIYCVIFSANTGMQTYNAIMSGSCIGDTLYCTGEQIENPEDSEKKANVAAWEKNTDCGPERKITSTGNVVGTAFPDGETDITMMATYLIAYYNDPAKTDLTQSLLDTLKISPTAVMGAVTDKLEATDNEDADTIAAAVEKILASCTDPTTGEKVDTEELESAKKGGSSAVSSGSGSGSSGSDSGSSGSSSSGSSSSTGSVKSGVETTIVFVMAGLMISAAGVAFLARKRRED